MKTSTIKFKLWQSLAILLTLVLAASVFLSLSPKQAVRANPQTGAVLADFIPEFTGNGRGMAFDGTNLYYTVENDSNIYKVTTAGATLATIPIAGDVAYGGPLAWDGSALWTMNYAPGSFILYRVDPADGSILSSCDIAAQNPGHPAVTSSPRNIGDKPDGLDWTGSSLWISSEIFSGNWVVEVDTNCNILDAFNPPANLGQEGYLGGTSGIAFDGVNLWHPTHTNSYLDMLIFQTDTNGATTSLSFVADKLTEDLAFDPATFAPLCALWGNEATFDFNNHLTAYEIPCPTQINQPPTTNAGPDQTVIWDPVGTKVTLDGSGSTDPDLDPLTYTWTGLFIEGGGMATGVSPMITLLTPGFFTVTLLVDDGKGGNDTDTIDITVLGPQGLKERAVNKLMPHTNESKRFVKAIKEIQKSLEANLWVNSTHLSPRLGHKVFNRERHAVKELMHLIEHPGEISNAALMAAQEVIEDLVKVDRLLAQAQIIEAQNTPVVNPNLQAKVNEKLAEANDELVQGDTEKNFGDFDEAITHYRKAWKDAIRALKFATMMPDDEDDDEEEEEEEEE